MRVLELSELEKVSGGSGCKPVKVKKVKCGKGSGKSSGKDSGKGSGKDSGKGSGKNSGKCTPIPPVCAPVEQPEVP